MNVLSLFDGMSCGQQALQRAGMNVNNYYASEIDKYGIKVTMANYPNTIQLGSVVDVDGYKLPKIDLLIGGSPCQSFSFAGKRKGMATKDEQEILTLDHYLQLKSEGFEFEGQSYLFWEYMRLLNEVKPKYFLLENVEMGEKWEKVLSKAIGVNGIHINSALVSAQNRRRIYWTNIGLEPGGLFGDLESIIEQPKDKGILLKDILQDNPNAKFYLSDKMIDYMNNRKDNFNNGKINYKTENDKASCLNKSSGSIDISDNIIVDEKYYLSEKSILKISKYNNSDRAINNNGKSICLQAGYSKIGHDNQFIVHNTMPRSSTTGKGGTGHLSRVDGKTYCLDTGNTNAVEIKRKVIVHNIPEIVSVRKFEVNILGLQKTLQEHKKLNNQKIADILNIPKTMVEHWFRTDTYFSIPDKDIWLKLKELLEIKTNVFDESIMTFEEKESIFEKTNRVYDEKGISPTLTSTNADERIMTNSRIRRLTPIECERLQTVADNYTNHVSDSQRYKMLGNGWTVDVIAHIFKYMK